MTDIKVGDRVRVSFEATVRRANSAFVSLEGDDGWIGELNYLKVPVEKIEPPVETFGPGDVVRAKGARSVFDHRTLGRDGYLAFPGGRFYRYGIDGFQASEFTSDKYERVEI